MRNCRKCNKEISPWRNYCTDCEGISDFKSVKDKAVSLMNSPTGKLVISEGLFLLLKSLKKRKNVPINQQKRKIVEQLRGVLFDEFKKKD